MAHERDFEKIALSLSEVFTPATAINSADLFCGRTTQIRAIVDAINQVGQHAILYGERGVGKTSLGRILSTKLKGREMVPIIAPMVNCDSGDDFSSIWDKVFSEVPEEYQDNGEPSFSGDPLRPRTTLLLMLLEKNLKRSQNMASCM